MQGFCQSRCERLRDSISLIHLIQFDFERITFTYREQNKAADVQTCELFLIQCEVLTTVFAFIKSWLCDGSSQSVRTSDTNGPASYFLWIIECFDFVGFLFPRIYNLKFTVYFVNSYYELTIAIQNTWKNCERWPQVTILAIIDVLIYIRYSSTIQQCRLATYQDV